MDAIIYFTMVKFSEWLDEELFERGWTRAELSRRANISQSSLSMIYSGQRKPGADLASSISKALGLPESVVFQAAGLLPPVSEEQYKLEELQYLLTQLGEDDLQEVIDYARHRLERQGKQQSSPKKSRARNALKNK